MKIEPIKVRPIHGGTQRLYKFDNGYGASVVKHAYSYGTELAVIKWEDEEEFHLCYSTPITSDVLGHLSEEDVENILSQIKELEAPNKIKEVK